MSSNLKLNYIQSICSVCIKGWYHDASTPLLHVHVCSVCIKGWYHDASTPLLHVHVCSVCIKGWYHDASTPLLHVCSVCIKGWYHDASTPLLLKFILKKRNDTIVSFQTSMPKRVWKLLQILTDS